MTEKIFINFTNHPSDKWGKEQMDGASAYGKVIDIPFPAVDPGATREEIIELASGYIDEIMKHHPIAVLCQGEFTLCYSVISGLKAHGVVVLAACSRRLVVETEEGKIVRFVFEGFREY